MIVKVIKNKEKIEKYNPYHDDQGKFTGPGGIGIGLGSFSLPKNPRNLQNTEIPRNVKIINGQANKIVTTSIGVIMRGGAIVGFRTQKIVENDTATSNTPGNMSKTREALNKLGVEHNPVQKEKTPRNEEEIISQLSGGDLTDGSCASLAFAYAANKAGYEVLDFRGGKSRSYFANANNEIELLKSLKGNLLVEENTSDLAASKALTGKMQEGKEYYFATGQHAAIVKKESGQVKYLELQSGIKDDNGWKDFNNKAIRKRFGGKQIHKVYGFKYQAKSIMADIESFNKNDEFFKIMGFINTSKGAQKKGANGSKK